MKLKAAGIIVLLLFISVYSVSASAYTQIQVKNTISPNIGAITMPRIQNVRPQLNLISLGKCLESDNGLDYLHAGTTIYFPRVTDHCRNEVAGMLEQCREFRIGSCLQYLPEECMPQSRSDRCINSTVLNEVYCHQFGLRETRHRCTNFCSSGRCY